MDIIGSLVPRSADTIQTVQRKQNALQACDNKTAFKPRLYSCINVQKGPAGISGVMTEVAAHDTLRGLDCMTEELFGGISVARCHMSSACAASMRGNQDEVLRLLRTRFEPADDSPPQPALLLSHLLPRPCDNDFFWLNQVCEIKPGHTLRNAILNDGRKQFVNFYDAYECVARRGAKQPHTAPIDTDIRDAALWSPSLHGTIGLYEQKTGDNPGFFLVCVSALPSVGAELVHALKADLMHRTTALDFCESKEMWFFKNMNRRNRQRLLLQAARSLEVQVAVQRDIYAHEKDEMQELALETCGTCTEFFDRAVVFERTPNLNLRIEDYASTARPVDAIRHFKGCVDLARHTGPVPVYVSAADGVVVLAPDAPHRSVRGVENDQCVFPAATAACAHSLFPVLNIAEDRADHNDKIRTELHAHPQFSLDDIAHHSMYTRTVLSDSVMKMLDARDSCGFGMFYGVQYAPPLPIMLYPRTNLTFVAACRDAPAPLHPPPPPPGGGCYPPCTTHCLRCATTRSRTACAPRSALLCLRCSSGSTTQSTRAPASATSHSRGTKPL